ncbi:MAG: DNA mismatch repair endonuclease MutL [Ruminococcaceae bacterium]|nr:DNA mismatch repair endonuclease MutL [Oscillospiraceae bacterium]
MEIKILSKNVAELIAAGEVVDRPASVVKELIENSIDAGASSIEIEIRGNGLSEIRVTDDGTGIPEDEIKTAFLRHATSKISNEFDLDSISTLGFRGEALPAISSVSRTSIISKTKSAPLATRYSVEGGEETFFGDAAGKEGTTVYVRDLFFNTPARMKFLKKDTSEGNAVQATVLQMALSNPDISFKLLREYKPVVITYGDGLYSAIHSVLPDELSDGMMAISFNDGYFEVSGYCGRPESARKSRSFQYSFVNGRYVKSSVISSAVEQAYRSFNMTGRFPAFVINVSLPFDSVDVNVHPAKTQVRFQNEGRVFSAVHKAVRYTLLENLAGISGYEGNYEEGSPNEIVISDKNSEMRLDGANVEEIVFERKAVSYSLFDSNRTSLVRESVPVYETNVYEPDNVCAINQEISPEARQFENIDIAGPDIFLRIAGELFLTYLICELGDLVIVIDKHAAHERMLYEQFGKGERCVDRQIKLVPETIPVSIDEKDAILENSEKLKKLGYLIEDFGPGYLIAREVPVFFGNYPIADAVLDMASQLIKGNEFPTSIQYDSLIHSISCRNAIKAGHKTSNEEILFLIDKVIRGEIPSYCPHGRPIYFEVKRSEFEKRFGRVR